MCVWAASTRCWMLLVFQKEFQRSQLDFIYTTRQESNDLTLCLYKFGVPEKVVYIRGVQHPPVLALHNTTKATGDGPQNFEPYQLMRMTSDVIPLKISTPT
ncbi:hypothetical protein TNCV_4042731 [Trichonephila clavipes]|nr:hypothetical protein TNCV_4042731 [Trichonephila clavipes]